MEQNEIRELLELAAKAAGLRVLDDWEYDESWGIKVADSNRRPYWFNPYHDDGDALRLAVQLAVNIDITEYEDSTYVYAGEVPRMYACEMWRGDRGAATRLAIVRAAAAIGERMQGGA